jgi:hypothetical protein
MRIYDQNEAPIYTQNKGQNLSDKYQLIDSRQVIKQFESLGFNYETTSSSKVRDPLRQGYQKHMMVFTRDDLVLDDGNKMQLLAINSHDGGHSLNIRAGVYRAVCANGLVAGADIYQQRVIHIGDVLKKTRESINEIVARSGDLRHELNLMQSRELSFQESEQLIKDAVDLRLNDIEGLYTVDLSSVDRLRRKEDKGQDLYTVFNRIQESIIRGGIRYQTRKVETNQFGHEYNKTRNATTKEIKSIAKSIEYNTKLWNKAAALVA